MKRWIALGVVALMVIGFGALAWGADADAELIIEESCIVDPFQFQGFPAAATAPDATGLFYNYADVTGRANYDVCLYVTIDGPLTDGAGHTLKTSLGITGDGHVDDVTAGSLPPYQVVHNGVDGEFQLEIYVDVDRNGYGDHAGTYTATVTVTCGPCI